MKKQIVLMGLVLVFIMMSAGMAGASIFTYTFNLGVGNTSGSPSVSDLPSPYATVTLDFLSNSEVNVTFQGDAFSTTLYPNGQYLLGDVGLNLNEVDNNLTASNFSFNVGSFPYNNTTSFSQGGAEQFDGFGIMNFSAQDNSTKGGFNEAVRSVSFTLTDSTENWQSWSDLLKVNDKGYFAAAHIYAWDGNTECNDGAITTGFAANGSTKVPEPGMLVLLGSGLAGLGLLGRKKFKK